MEKRLLFAIVLSFVILFIWQAVFVKRVPPQEATPETPTEETTLQPRITEQQPSILDQKLQPEEKPTPKEQPSQETFEAKADSAERDIVIDSSLFRAVWSNRGAVLKSWRLKEHLDANDEPLELISNRTADLKQYPFLLNTDDPDFNRLINAALYTVSKADLRLQDGQKEEVRFEYAQEDGTKIEKIFVFTGGTYAFDIEINVWKNGMKVEPRLIWGPGLGNITQTSRANRMGIQSGISVLSAGRVYHADTKKYKPETSAFNFVNWAAFVDQYFAAMFFTSPQNSFAQLIKEDIQIESQETATPQVISYYFLSVTNPEKAYIGPKEFDRMVALGNGAKGIIRYGLFGFISEILFRAMKAVHTAIPNWGLCIIIITILVKIIFFPLTYSSTRSMAKMQELQPKIKALRSKYKKAKQDIAQRRKLNEETMKLYKEHGVNPAGGCLPMLIQLPIFWGFFRMLMVSIEFRHSPFILWIKDLSVHDPIYVTPILMGITQYISQKMTPTSADPSQQRMMLIMPVIMTIFFMNFSSGLVLYWLTNNVLQIAQQYIMNRIQKKKKSQSHGKRRK